MRTAPPSCAPMNSCATTRPVIGVISSCKTPHSRRASASMVLHWQKAPHRLQRRAQIGSGSRRSRHYFMIRAATDSAVFGPTPVCAPTMSRRWLVCMAASTAPMAKAPHQRRPCRRTPAPQQPLPDTEFVARTRRAFRTRVVSLSHRKTTRHRSHAPGSRTARSQARQDTPMTQVTPTTKRITRKAQAAPHHIPPPVADTSKPAPATEVAARAPQPVPPIPQSAMQDAAFARNWWWVVIDAERTPYDRVLADVAVWGPNEAKLRARHLVEMLDAQSTPF